MIRLYQPSNSIGQAGWLLLMAMLLGGSGVIGALASAAAQNLYLPLIYPLAMGLAAGILARLTLHVAKVRNPKLSWAFALVFGAAIYFNFNWFEHQAYRSAAPATEQPETVVNQADKTDLWKFILERTQLAVRFAPMRFVMTLPSHPLLAWHWLVELGIVESLALSLVYGKAKQPFCEPCDRWYSHSTRLGTVKSYQSQEFQKLLAVGEYGQAGQLIDPIAKPYSPDLDVWFGYCADCPATDYLLHLKINQVDKNGLVQARPGQLTLLDAEQASRLKQVSIEKYNPDYLPLALKERSKLRFKDVYKPHDLPLEQLLDIQRQLAAQPKIKTAYLVQKQLEYFAADHPTYVLAVRLGRSLIKSATHVAEWESRIGSSLIVPGNLLVMVSNRRSPLWQKISQIEGAHIYTKAAPEPPPKTMSHADTEY